MTIEEMAQQEIIRNRAMAEFNKNIAKDIWGWNK